MQTKERYWEGLYWDGFDPNAVGAIPLWEHEYDDEHEPILSDAR